MENWQEFTEETIAALLEDGSDPDAMYTIEHHFYHGDFTKLEKLAVEVFKLGFEVTDAEEIELDDGSMAWVFDAIREQPLDVDAIVADALRLEKLAATHKIEYDGWGTYFEDEDGFELDDEDDD
jgi:regulator of RNase E activity RraB